MQYPILNMDNDLSFVAYRIFVEVLPPFSIFFVSGAKIDIFSKNHAKSCYIRSKLRFCIENGNLYDKIIQNITRESIMSKVALKPLDTRSRTIISVSLFVVVFTILITLASIFDFQVSQILTKNALKPGEYISNDLFGFVGEALGTSPIYIVLGVCTSLLCWFFAKSFDKKVGA